MTLYDMPDITIEVASLKGDQGLVGPPGPTGNVVEAPADVFTFSQDGLPVETWGANYTTLNPQPSAAGQWVHIGAVAVLGPLTTSRKRHNLSLTGFTGVVTTQVAFELRVTWLQNSGASATIWSIGSALATGATNSIVLLTSGSLMGGVDANYLVGASWDAARDCPVLWVECFDSAFTAELRMVRAGFASTVAEVNPGIFLTITNVGVGL